MLQVRGALADQWDRGFGGSLPCACVYMYICRYAWEWRDVVMMLRRNWMGWDGWMDGRKE